MAQPKKNIHRRNRGNQQGFTLLETVISMFVLTIGLVSLLGVVGMAMSATEAKRQLM